jgi:hypothetical protein
MKKILAQVKIGRKLPKNESTAIKMLPIDLLNFYLG